MHNRSAIAIVLLLIGLTVPAGGANPASAHQGTCAPRTNPDAALLFGDSIGVSVFDVRELSPLIVAPPSAVYLEDWYLRRGFDVCNLASGNQSLIGHWQGSGPVDPISGEPVGDLLDDVGEVLPSWVENFLTEALNLTEGPHLDLTTAVDDFDPTEVVLQSGAATWALTLVLEWYSAWQTHGGSLPSGNSYHDHAGSVVAMLQAQPDWPGPGTFLEHVDAVTGERLLAMGEALAGAMSSPVEQRRVIWLTRPPVDPDAGLGVQPEVNEKYLQPIYAGQNRVLTEIVDGVTTGSPQEGEVTMEVVPLGLDDGVGGLQRIDPASGRDLYTYTDGSESFTDGHHLFDYGGWRAAWNVCLALGHGYTADSGATRCEHSNDLSRVIRNHTWTDGSTALDPTLHWVFTYELMAGYADATFRPAHQITRGQAARVGYRFMGEPSLAGLPNHGWSDIPSWLQASARWLYSTSPALMTGFSDGTFRPGDPITRAQAVRLAYRLAGEPDVSLLPPHGLDGVPAWVEDAVRWASAEHAGAGQPLIHGIGGEFRPDVNIHRGTFASMLFRLASAPAAWGHPEPMWSHQWTD